MACDEEQDGRLILAKAAGLGDISVCTCGAITMSLGEVTLRLTAEAFAGMLRMCEDAASSPVLQVIQADAMRLAATVH